MTRRINEQVVVITGASSGIGREAALQFGRKGASVVLAARNEMALNEVAQQIERLGGKAHVVVTDVAEWPQVERLAQIAIDQYGRIDTWVNNAGVSSYSLVEEASVEELERIIQVNLMGQIYGIKAVLGYMKHLNEGTIINVASGLGARAVPLQSAYCASKSGVIGFSEALRMELTHQKSNIKVTTVLPSSINTPFFSHARSKSGLKPRPVPLVYKTELVAQAIVFAAQHPRREIYVGGVGKALAWLEQLSPALLDWLMVQGGLLFKLQQSKQPVTGPDNLFEPIYEPGATTGEFGKETTPLSPYTTLLEFHPNRKRVLFGAALVGAVALFRRK